MATTKQTEADKLAEAISEAFTTTEWSDDGAAGCLSGTPGTAAGALWFIGNQLQDLAKAMNRIAGALEDSAPWHIKISQE